MKKKSKKRKSEWERRREREKKHFLQIFPFIRKIHTNTTMRLS
jgi:hypothetical protein